MINAVDSASGRLRKWTSLLDWTTWLKHRPENLQDSLSSRRVRWVFTSLPIFSLSCTAGTLLCNDTNCCLNHHQTRATEPEVANWKADETNRNKIPFFHFHFMAVWQDAEAVRNSVKVRRVSQLWEVKGCRQSPAKQSAAERPLTQCFQQLWLVWEKQEGLGETRQSNRSNCSA